MALSGGSKLTTLSSIGNAPKWSMRGRDAGGKGDGAQKSASPGPGAYGVPVAEKTKYSRAPQASFGTSMRDRMGRKNALPGPGTYDQKDKGCFSPKTFFGTSMRDGLTGRARTPGPGSYEVRGMTGEGPTVSFSARYKTSARSSTPGPGAYGLPKYDNFEATPKFGFGTSTRPGVGDASKTPGPGTYAQISCIGNNPIMMSSPKFTMKPRRDPVGSQGSGNPGPGGPVTMFG